MEATLDRIRAIVGPKGWTCDPAAMAPYLADWRGRFHGRTPMVVRPGTVAEVAAVVRVCREAGLPLVPQAGNTGLVGGSIPFETGRELVVSVARLNRIRSLDPGDDTVTAEAGCVLKTVQDAADAVDRRLPLSFGAEGTCQIGGCLSTNAGGTLTLRYGNARDLVLGLEVVLPDGRLWSGLRRLRKDNTGYDLKHLFLGAEGTLGIITAAVLKLVPKPKQIETAFAAIPDPAAALAVLARVKDVAADALTAFELIPRIGLDFALRHVAGTVDPLAESHPWYLLIELSGGQAGNALRAQLEEALGDCFENGTITDAAIAESGAQSLAFWQVREAIVESQRFEGASLKNDVAVPVAMVPTLIDRATAAVSGLIPGIRPVPFGHVGDGNIHFNLNQPVGADPAAFLARWDEVQSLVNGVVRSLGGSISAEHGIGRIKIAELAQVKDPVELDLMRAIKRTLDPTNIMNPGKVLGPD